MARRTISLDEKIEKAEAAVLEAKARYDKVLDELEKLLKRGNSWKTNEFLKRIIKVTRRLMR